MLLHHRFILAAKQRPTKAAIIDRTTGRTITYSKALIASLILADKFESCDPGFIGVMIPTSAGCALTVLGALISGRVPVMINYSTGAAANAEFAQAKCGFRTIVASKALLEKIGCPRLDGMIFIEDIMAGISAIDKIKSAIRSKLPGGLLTRSLPKSNENDPAVVLFTSGSEKEPKAVPLSHRNIAGNIESLGRVFDLSEQDRFLANLPYFHVFGQTANLWLPLYYGMTLVAYANPLDYKTVCRIVREEKITLMVGTPSFFWGYLQKSAPGDFKTVRIALAGADKCPDALREGFLTKHSLTLYEAYGTTETSPAISANTPRFNRPGSVGQVLPNVTVRIEDPATGADAARGQVGKILVKGDLVMAGYHDDIEETSFRLRRGWYDTGDMGYLDEDGYLWHAGRLKRFVKIGGEMVSLVRVENVLESILPDNIACCVVEIPDTVKGARIVAAVTAAVDERQLLARMAERLPNIALPKQFIILEELPFMGSGKVDFRRVTGIVQAAKTGAVPTMGTSSSV